MLLVVAAVITAVLIPIAVLWLLPVIADVTSLARRNVNACADSEETGPVRLLVLVPAHDEAASIEACIASILAARCEAAEVRLCVIADHCTDATVPLAEAAGAEVLSLTAGDPAGKPQAIRRALDHYGYDAYDAVVIIDADAIVERGFVAALCAHAGLRNLALQATVVVGNEDESALTYLGAMLARTRYGRQYPLKQRAGLNVPLTGNGMCLGTELLHRVGWPDDTLTENWELYARCAVSGDRIALAADAVLRTVEAPTMTDGAIQRRRWQAGRATVFAEYASAIIATNAIGWRHKVEVLGELAAPGPVFQAVAIVVAIPALLLTTTPVSLIVAACLLLALAHSVVWALSACALESERARVIRAFAALPLYALWRVCVVFPALRRDNRVWLRSPRPAMPALSPGEAAL